MNKQVLDFTKKAVYRVYYPQEGCEGLFHEDFEGSDEEAKAAAEDFADNFDRTKVTIKKISDSELNVGDEYTTENDKTAIIEGAFYAGFEPSSDTLTGEALFIEASDYLFYIQFQ